MPAMRHADVNNKLGVISKEANHNCNAGKGPVRFWVDCHDGMECHVSFVDNLFHASVVVLPLDGSKPGPSNFEALEIYHSVCDYSHFATVYLLTHTL